MASWLVYWTPKNVEDFEMMSNFRMDCIGSLSADFSTALSKGDTVWIHSIDREGYHSILGKLIIAEYYDSREETAKRIKRPLATVKYTQYWVAEMPWDSIRDIPFGEVPRALEFVSGKRLPKNYNGQNFQVSRREITDEDNQMILDLWNAWTE